VYKSVQQLNYLKVYYFDWPDTHIGAAPNQFPLEQTLPLAPTTLNLSTQEYMAIVLSILRLISTFPLLIWGKLGHVCARIKDDTLQLVCGA